MEIKMKQLEDMVETAKRAQAFMDEAYEKDWTYDMARYSYSNHHKCTLSAATDAIENIEFITRRKLAR